jgi:hypothetical protein
MINVEECRKRAEECLAAALSASDGDAQRTWLHLSDLWLLSSKHLVQSPSEATINSENNNSKPITERAIHSNGKAVA